MFGNTPPWAIVTPDNSLFNSSSFLMANCKTSAAKYSMTAAKYTSWCSGSDTFAVVSFSQQTMDTTDREL
ncbi:Uncharacterized protein FWK35_00001812 [Aphis craccivora]|uniref:Uncharacterized protein n=1 Tax=Aphis craccivora TaxID=307492 RepID=A0A6G0ZC42_APHCR|nr:Uncharacterized protein FWK35_00001812 [Aphis craccivora]